MKKQTTLWKTKSGGKIRICDMTDNHLKNAIKYLERHAEETHQMELDAAWSVSAGFDPDSMASYYADQDIDRMQEMSTEEWLDQNYPIYEKLTLEAERRKLKI